MAWLKELQRLWRVCECFFFLSKQLNSTKSTGWIYKQIHFSKKKNYMTSIYTFKICVFEVLFACVTQFWRCYGFFFILSAVCLLFGFFLYVALRVCNSKTCQIFVNVMKMWKDVMRAWSSFSSVVCRTVWQRCEALCSFWHPRQWPDVSNILSFVLIHANDLFLYFENHKNEPCAYLETKLSARVPWSIMLTKLCDRHLNKMDLN